MTTSRFLQAAVGGVFLLLCFSFLAAAPMHTAPSVASQLPPDPMRAGWTPTPPSVEEQFFFQSANRERATEGLPQLKWDDALAAAARKHAALMADQNEMSHRLPGEAALEQRAAQAGARFSSVGENIAIGPESPEIHNGWMHSPGHRANILGASFNALGVGVVDRDGQLYSVEDFSHAIENLSVAQQEKKVGALLSARGITLSRSQDDAIAARKICEAGGGRAGGVNPTHLNMVIFQYETPDLSNLPEQLEHSLRGSKYHEAAVGACSPLNAEGSLPRFHVVVLLFSQS